MVELLLKLGADANFKDSTGKPALCAAAEQGHLNVLQILLKNGGYIDLKDADGKGAIDRLPQRRSETPFKRRSWWMWN